MTTAAQAFAQIGRALFGDHFKAPMAAVLEVSVDRVDDWGKGRGNPPPAGVWRDLVQILDDRLSSLPRLRTAALAAANATGLKVQVISFDATHAVVDATKGVLHKGTLDSCDQFVAAETERAFRAVGDAAPPWRLASRLAKAANELAIEIRHRGLSQGPFDEKNVSGVLSLVYESIDTGERKNLLGALGMLEALRLRMPMAVSTNEATRQPAYDLSGNKPTGPERSR
jgi:hypothetical protein